LRQRRERYGGDFRSRLEDYTARDRASADEMHVARRDKLRALLSHATAHIPHWRETFRAAGLDPAGVEGPDDLAVLPVLTKADVLRLGTQLLWPGAPRHELRKVHTSGTTGAGLVFMTTRDAIRDQWAVWWRYRARLGWIWGRGRERLRAARSCPGTATIPAPGA
jgi:phenylacetate-CoA ligase